MTKLAITADLHIDDYGSRLDPGTGLSVRFADGLRIARWIAQDALDRGCDALIVAGDFTESGHPGAGRAARIAEALDEFPGPKVLTRGNHDHERDGRSIVDVLARSLTDARGFSRPGITWVNGATAICVVPYLDRRWARTQAGFENVPDANVWRWLGDQFLAIVRGLYAEAHTFPALESVVLVMHQALSGGRMNEYRQAFMGDQSLVIDTGALAAIGFDAILAGHFHLHDVIRDDEQLVLSIGSPQGADFGEQDQVKGYVVLDTDTGKFEQVPTPAIRFLTLTGEMAGYEPGDCADAVVRGVDLDPSIDLAQLRRELTEEGALQVWTLSHRRTEAIVRAEALGEDLGTDAALAAYFEPEPDRDALVELGRELVGAVTA